MTPASGKILILLVDDHTVVREGLKLLVETQPDIRVIGEADNGRAAVELAQTLQPAVVVMDIALPVLNGIEATRQITSRLPGTRVLVLSAYADDEYIQRTIAAGASGYLVKQTMAKVLCRAIRVLHEGGTYFCPTIACRLGHKPETRQRPETLLKAIPRLTARQREVLQLIAEGNPNKQVADHLRISIKTVEKHRQNIMDKLRIHDTAGLTRYAIAERIIGSSVPVLTVDAMQPPPQEQVGSGSDCSLLGG